MVVDEIKCRWLNYAIPTDIRSLPSLADVHVSTGGGGGGYCSVPAGSAEVVLCESCKSNVMSTGLLFS